MLAEEESNLSIWIKSEHLKWFSVLIGSGGGGTGQGDRFSRVALAGLELTGLLAPVSQVLGLKLEGTRSSNSLHVETFCGKNEDLSLRF